MVWDKSARIGTVLKTETVLKESAVLPEQEWYPKYRGSSEASCRIEAKREKEIE